MHEAFQAPELLQVPNVIIVQVQVLKHYLTRLGALNISEELKVNDSVVRENQFS